MKPLYEMTFEEFKENVSNLPDCYVKNPESLLEILFNRLKEALTPNPDEIHIVWSVEDVYTAAMEIKANITKEQAIETIKRLKNLDASELGINYDTVAHVLKDVLEGK